MSHPAVVGPPVQSAAPKPTLPDETEPALFMRADVAAYIVAAHCIAILPCRRGGREPARALRPSEHDYLDTRETMARHLPQYDRDFLLSHPALQALADARNVAASELNSRLHLGDPLATEDVVVELRTLGIPATKPLDAKRPATTILKMMSIGCGVISERDPLEPELPKDYYQVVRDRVRNYDLVLLQLSSPLGDPVIAGGLVHTVELAQGVFKVALFAYQPPTMPGEDRSLPRPWICLSSEQRAALIAAHRPLFSADGQPLYSQAGRPKQIRTTAKLVKFGNIAQTISKIQILSAPRTPFTRRPVALTIPETMSRLVDGIKQYLAMPKYLPLLELDRTNDELYTAFVLELIALGDACQTQSMLWGKAGTGKTGFLVDIVTAMVFLRQRAAIQSSLNTGPDDSTPGPCVLQLPNGALWDLEEYARRKVICISESNASARKFSRRLHSNLKANGLSSTWMTHACVISELTSEVQHTNDFCRAMRIYQHVLPYDIGAQEQHLDELDAEMSRLKRFMSTAFVDKKQQSGRPRGERLTDDEAKAVHKAVSQAREDVGRYENEANRLRALLDIMRDAVEMMRDANGDFDPEFDLTQLILLGKFTILFERAFSFRLIEGKHFFSLRLPGSDSPLHLYAFESALPRDWQKFKGTSSLVKNEIQGIHFIRSRAGIVSVIPPHRQLPFKYPLGLFCRMDCAVIVCTQGLFLSQIGKTKLARQQGFAVIMDEAGQQFISDYAACLAVADNSLAAGDKAQRGPYMGYKESLLREKQVAQGYHRSPLALMMDKPAHMTASLLQLSESRRHHPDLANALSQICYGGSLASAPYASLLRTGPAHQPSGALSPFVVIDVKTTFNVERLNALNLWVYNTGEALVAARFMHTLHRIERAVYNPKTQTLSDFFALSPYTGQVQMLAATVKEYYPELLGTAQTLATGVDQRGRLDLDATYPLFTASTVQKSQGMEKAYAVVSLTRSGQFAAAPGVPGRVSELPGFVEETMLTTAFTRAMRGLVIVCDVDFWMNSERTQPLIRKAVEMAHATGSYFDLTQDSSDEAVDRLFDF